MKGNSFTTCLRMSLVGIFLGLTPFAASALERVNLGLDFLPGPGYSAYFYGVKSGIYEKNGIDLRIGKGLGSGDTLIKLAGGAIDFGLADISALYTAREQQKVPVKLISVIQSISPHSLFVMKDSGINGFSDLAGKKIGITPGNSHKLYFPEVAKVAGLDPESIRWVTVDAAAMGPLLISGRIDAAPFFASHYYFINKQAEKVGKEIKVLPFADAGFSIYSLSLHTAEKTIEKRPDLVRAFLKATWESWDAAKNNPQAACEATVSMNPEVNVEDCKQTFSAVLKFTYTDVAKMDGQGYAEKERLINTYKVVAKAQGLDPNLDPADGVDMRFLPVSE